MHFRCVFTLLQWCVLVGLDWAEPMMFLTLHVTCLCIFHAYVPSFIFILILTCVGAFLCLSFSLSFLQLVALWHLNENPLRPRTLFVLGHLPLILPPPMLGFVIRRPSRTSRRTFHDAAFIQNAKSFYQIFPILTFPPSSIVGVRSHCMASSSLVPSWSYKSFTPICTDSILQYLILLLAFEVCAS